MARSSRRAVSVAPFTVAVRAGAVTPNMHP